MMMLMMGSRRCRGRCNPMAVRFMALLMLAAAVIGAIFLLVPRKAAAQGASQGASQGAAPAARSVAIMIMRGTDTVVVERIERSARSVTATITAVQQPRVTMQLTTGADHLVPTMSFSVQAPNASADAAPMQTGTLTMRADSVVMSITAGGTTRDIRRAVRPNTMAIVNNDFVILEQSVRRARALKVTALDVPVFAVSNAQQLVARLDLVGRDSARFTVANNVTAVSLDAEGNVTGGMIVGTPLRVVVVEGAAATRVSGGRPDYSAPKGAPYTAQEVMVRTPAGHTLAGTLTLPAGASSTAKVPAVVTITGSGQQDRDEFLPFAGGVRIFRQVADTLSRRGIAVLRLDDRGIGGSGGDAAGTSADFANDIRAAITWLRMRPEVDAARIGLVGHSEGGMIAPMIAAEDADVAAIVLMAGTAYTGRAIIDYQMDNSVRGNAAIPAAKKDSIIQSLKASFDSSAAKEPWMRFFLTYDPIPTIKRVKQPVLILQGATDQQVRPEEARALDKALREAGNTRVALRIVPERNHLFLRDPVGHPSGYPNLRNGRVDAQVLGPLADWLVATLRVVK